MPCEAAPIQSNIGMESTTILFAKAFLKSEFIGAGR
jgi:hypothetical protein